MADLAREGKGMVVMADLARAGKGVAVREATGVKGMGARKGRGETDKRNQGLCRSGLGTPTASHTCRDCI